MHEISLVQAMLQQLSDLAVQNQASKIIKITKEIGYNAEYAAAVHERLDMTHDYAGSGNPNGQAKYLETALEDVGAKALRVAAAAELRRLGR